MIDDRAPVGRVDVVLIDDGAVVCWLAHHEGRDALLGRRVRSNGDLGPVVELTPMSAGRDSGFAQLERTDDGLLLVWRDVEQRLRSKVVRIEAFD